MGKDAGNQIFQQMSHLQCDPVAGIILCRGNAKFVIVEVAGGSPGRNSRIAAASLPPIPLRRQASHAASDKPTVSTRTSGSCRMPALSAGMVKTSGGFAAVPGVSGTGVPARRGYWPCAESRSGGLDSGAQTLGGAPVLWGEVFVSYENSTFLKSIPKAYRAFWQNKSENDHQAKNLGSWHGAMNGSHSRCKSGENPGKQKPVESAAR